MTVVKKTIPSKPVESAPKQPVSINLNELSDAQLLTAVYQQQDTVAALRQQLAQEEHKLSVIDAEGRKRAKPIEGL